MNRTGRLPRRYRKRGSRTIAGAARRTGLQAQGLQAQGLQAQGLQAQGLMYSGETPYIGGLLQ
jgi:hypothetical protein